jgi:Hydrolases of the alpha/beta superfamily
MGAVSALFSACNNLDVGSMVLDSPFTSMKTLAYEIARKKSSAPEFIFRFVYKRIRKTIEEKAGFDLNSLNPINLVSGCFQPALFITGKNDDFVEPHHTQEMYQAYTGDKDILYVDGDHNSPRPRVCLQKVANFFYSTLLCDRIPKRIKSIRKKKNRPIDANTDDALLNWAIEESLNEFKRFQYSK